jgi:DNA polymerase-1
VSEPVAPPDLPHDIFLLARQDVLGEGPVPCDVMFVAEAPGRQEDWAGRPLVGPSGRLFNKLLERFTTVRRPDVYVTNVVKHWTGPGNPAPKVAQCKPYRSYLYWELQRVQPKVVICLGAVAVREFDKAVRLKQDHGHARPCVIKDVWEGTLVPWYHPAWVFRNPGIMSTLIADAEKLHEEVIGVTRPRTSAAYDLATQGDAATLCLGQWGELGFDTETTSPTRAGQFATDEAEMVGFSLSQASGTGVYVPGGEVGLGMATVLSSPLWTKICHNAKFELKVLARTGVQMVGWEDTRLAAYLLGHNRTGLKDLTRELLGHQPTVIKELWPKDGPEMENCTWQQAHDTYAANYEYAAADADNTRRLWPGFKKRLLDEGLWELYEVEKKLTPVLVDMERIGMNVDVDRCNEVEAELYVRYANAKAATCREFFLAGIHEDALNINAPDQLEAALVKLGAPLRRLTDSKTRFSVDRTALEDLLAKGWHTEIIQPLLDMRKYRDLAVYVKRFVELRGPDGRLHTSFNQAGHWEESGDIDPKSSPATGRLSSSAPNLMNIPHHRATVGGIDWAPAVRSCLVASKNCMLMSVDLGQEEPRIIAVVAQDHTLLEGFNNGQDIYRPATQALYPLSIDPKLSDADWSATFSHERFVGKTFFLAWYYGAGAGRLLKLDPSLTRNTVGRALDELRKAHPARQQYLDNIAASLSATGRVESLRGRRRRLYKYWSPVQEVKDAALREGANDRIQATAADILKIAMPAIAKELTDRGLFGHLISTVHDEVVLEMPLGEVDVVNALVAKAFRDLLPGLPLEVETSVGTDWGHMERI